MRPALLHHIKRAFVSLSAVVAFATLVAVAPLPSHAQDANSTKVSHFKLANGLEVVVIPDHRTPVVTHMLWYRVGAADETAGKTGLAHFLEHLLFKGTKKNPQGLFSQTVATIGGQENAFTSADYTGYFQRTAREHLKTLMEFESDRMTGLVLTEEVVRPELAVVLEEQNMRIANNPSARLEVQMDASLYLNHPYGRPIIGWRQEIEGLTSADALAFYKRFYTPNNAILVVAGDVTAEEVKKLAEETYGKIEIQTPIAPRQRPQEPLQEAPRSVTLADARVTQPSMQRMYLAPSYATAKPGEAEALDVLSHILGRGSNSRIYQTLVVEKGITAAELDRSRSRMIADEIYAQDSQATLARWYGAALTTGSTVEQVQSWTDRIKSVTTDQVREAARRTFDKRRSVTGYLIKDAQTVEKRP